MQKISIKTGSFAVILRVTGRISPYSLCRFWWFRSPGSLYESRFELLSGGLVVLALMIGCNLVVLYVVAAGGGDYGHVDLTMSVAI
jgi:hypothetical protein